MRKSIVFGLAVVVALMLGLGSLYAQPMGPGMMGQGGGRAPGYGPQPQGGWYCPRGGGWGMGPGMMGPGWQRGSEWGPGYGMNPGRMGPGYDYRQQNQQPQKPLEKGDAETIVKNYLDTMKNPNLKLGRINDGGTAFEVEIVTKDNSLVDKVLVDKNSGSMRSAY
jgi:hypothetical protein